MKNALFAAALAAVAFAAPASAITLNFDDVATFTEVGAGYNGFDFTNFYALDTTQYNASGYVNGVVSLNNVLYNAFADPASISSASAFQLTSAYLTGAWNDGLNIQVDGYKNNTLIYTQNFLVDTAGPMLVNFNNALVDNVVFSSFGGTNAGYEGGGDHFAMDNLTINGTSGAVPEPASWALMIVGFGMVGGSLRRRATVVAA